MCRNGQNDFVTLVGLTCYTKQGTNKGKFSDKDNHDIKGRADTYISPQFCANRPLNQ